MGRATILVMLLTAGCDAHTAYDWTGLWAGTNTETMTDSATGEVRTAGPVAAQIRISRDADGLYVDGSCSVPLLPTSDTAIRLLPVVCTTSSARVDVLSGFGARTGSDMHVQMVSDWRALDGSGTAHAVDEWDVSRTR